MTDPSPYPEAPRWVKLSGIIAIALAVLVVAALFTGLGGPHGPGRHMQSGHLDGQADGDRQ